MKALDFGSPGLIKRMRYVDYLVAKQDSGSIGFTVERDYGTRSRLTCDLDHLDATAAGMLWATGVWGTGIWGGSSANDATFRIACRGVARVFQPKFSSQDRWYLKGISFGLQPTRRR
jgi:hypothetical protein